MAPWSLSVAALATGVFSVAIVSLALVGCDDARPNGEPCLKDRDCESGFCRSSVCASRPHDTPETVSSGVGTAGGTSAVGGAGGSAGQGGTSSGRGGSGAGLAGGGGTGGV
jgi:hypothetical protein